MDKLSKEFILYLINENTELSDALDALREHRKETDRVRYTIDDIRDLYSDNQTHPMNVLSQARKAVEYCVENDLLDFPEWIRKHKNES